MAKQVDTVQKGDAITAEAWNELVARVNRLERERYNFIVPRRAKKTTEESSGDVYVGGLGIDVGAFDADLGGRPITNTGVLSVRISGSAYEAKGEPFNLASSHFLWRVSSLSGGYEAWVKTHRVSVVTDITNGVVTKKTIEVVGEE